LSQGSSIAVGLAYAAKMDHKNGRFIVLQEMVNNRKVKPGKQQCLLANIN